MNAVLVLHNEDGQNLRVMVSLKNKKLKEQVITLLEEDRGKEAFEILKSKAEVRAYLPSGTKPLERAEVTLFEDLL